MDRENLNKVAMKIHDKNIRKLEEGLGKKKLQIAQL